MEERDGRCQIQTKNGKPLFAESFLGCWCQNIVPTHLRPLGTWLYIYSFKGGFATFIDMQVFFFLQRIDNFDWCIFGASKTQTPTSRFQVLRLYYWTTEVCYRNKSSSEQPELPGVIQPITDVIVFDFVRVDKASSLENKTDPPILPNYNTTSNVPPGGGFFFYLFFFLFFFFQKIYTRYIFFLIFHTWRGGSFIIFFRIDVELEWYICDVECVIVLKSNRKYNTIIHTTTNCVSCVFSLTINQRI